MKHIGTLLVALALVGTVGGAQKPVVEQGVVNLSLFVDPMASLIPPDVVLAHADAIGLKSSQKEQIERFVKDAQLDFTYLQPKLTAESTRLGMLLRNDTLDTQDAQRNERDRMTTIRLAPEGVVNYWNLPYRADTVLAMVDRVLAAERDIKRRQITLLVQVHNALTLAQRDALRKLMAAAAPRRGDEEPQRQYWLLR